MIDKAQDKVQYIRWFENLDQGDLALVGGKNASLGEMYQSLSGAGVPVPNGFALTTAVYAELLAAGAARIFGPGTPIVTSATQTLDAIEEKQK